MKKPITDITVKLTGKDGNAYAILGQVRRALKDEGLNKEAEQFTAEATSGDYCHLLQTCAKYVNVK